jgi:hypothetical protein
MTELKTRRFRNSDFQADYDGTIYEKSFKLIDIGDDDKLGEFQGTVVTKAKIMAECFPAGMAPTREEFIAKARVGSDPLNPDDVGEFDLDKPEVNPNIKDEEQQP